MESIERIYEILDTNKVGDFSVISEYENYITISQKISDSDRVFKIVYDENSDEISVYENDARKITLRYEGSKEIIKVSTVGVMLNYKYISTIFADTLEIRKYKLYSNYDFIESGNTVCTYSSENFDIEFVDNILRINTR